jgi:hypothetical protein
MALRTRSKRDPTDETSSLIDRTVPSSSSSWTIGGIVLLSIVAIIATALAITFGVLWGNIRENSPSVRFAVIGDTNYANFWKISKEISNQTLDKMINELNSQNLDFVVYIGDIGAATAYDCLNDGFMSNVAKLRKLRHPLIYTPGDNEWHDCLYNRYTYEWRNEWDPTYDLLRLRQVMFSRHIDSHGQLYATNDVNDRKIALSSQKDDPSYSDFIENTMWHIGETTFCTYHNHGSECDSCTYGGNVTLGTSMLILRDTKVAANVKWIETCFATARTRGSKEVMLFAQMPLQPNFMTPKVYKLDDATANLAEKMSYSLRIPAVIHTQIIEKIQSETLNFGPVARVENEEYMTILASLLAEGFTKEDIDTFFIGSMFTNFNLKAGGYSVDHFAGDVHMPTPSVQNMPQANAFDPDGFLSGGWGDAPIDNFRQHIVTGSFQQTGYILVEVYPNTKTPVHVMHAPFVTIPYSSTPVTSIGPIVDVPYLVKRKNSISPKTMTSDEIETVRCQLLNRCKNTTKISTRYH